MKYFRQWQLALAAYFALAACNSESITLWLNFFMCGTALGMWYIRGTDQQLEDSMRSLINTQSEYIEQLEERNLRLAKEQS